MSVGFKNRLWKYLLIAFSLLYNSANCATVVVSHEDCTIQEAIDNAIDGDTIEVHSGLYLEHINISKPVILLGLDSGGGVPIITSRDAQSVIEINVERVTFEGFYVKSTDNSDGIGIVLASNDSILRNNVIENNGYRGIQILNGFNNTIINNSISNNDCGIYLSNADKSTIHLNKINHNYIGIQLEDSSSTNITGNNITDNSIGYLYDTYSLIFAKIDNTNNFYGNDRDSQDIGEVSQYS